jgi:hypothetical protein
MQRLAPLRVPLREFYGLTQYGREPRGVVGASLGRLYFGDRVPSVPAVRGAVQTPEISLPEFGPEFVNRYMARSFQHGQCQDSQKYERPLAAFGVGYRSPFADVGLARFAFALSDRLKIRWGVEKYVLRRALADVVPPEFLSRPKFPGIMAVDEAFSARLDELAAEVLSREAVEQRGWFSHAELRTLQRPGSQAPYSREGAMRLWTPLLTELWAQEFLDGRGRAPIDSKGEKL